METCTAPIHQILPFLAFGDAIGNLVLNIRALLREWGHESEIFAENWDPRLAKECHSYQEYSRFSHPDNLLILHYSTGGLVNRFVLGLPDRVILYYHNVTPAHYFYWVNGDLAQDLREARHDLEHLIGQAPAICDSLYNKEELERMGFRVLGVVPPILSFAHLDGGVKNPIVHPNSPPYNEKETINWLHVGRLAPNKCISDILKAFYFFHTWITPRSRLFLVGSEEGMEIHVRDLRQLTTKLGLEEAVIFTGRVSDLAKYYRTADAYISMSEHEGFCIPLVEAMYCNTPILAYASTGIPSTLGNAGILFRHKVYPVIAEMVHEVLTNELLRTKILQVQRARVLAFSPDAVHARLKECLDLAFAQ